MGVDQDYKNLMKQGTRAALADGWGGSMLGTDIQDIIFGTPYPLQSEANLGVMKEDHVNIIVHGHEPVLSEMIIAVSEKEEVIKYAKKAGAKGIQTCRNLLYSQRNASTSRNSPWPEHSCSRNWLLLPVPAMQW